MFVHFFSKIDQKRPLSSVLTGPGADDVPCKKQIKTKMNEQYKTNMNKIKTNMN